MLTAHGDPNEWVLQVPLALLAIRTALKEDLGCSAAELVYGTPLRLPSDFFEPDTAASVGIDQYVESLRQVFEKLRPVPTRAGNMKSPYVTEDLMTATHVFVRQEKPRKLLHPHYQGPFPVVTRRSDTFVLRINGKADTVALHHLKPAHLEPSLTKEVPTKNKQKKVNWKDLSNPT